jgi:hypothetical protein
MERRQHWRTEQAVNTVGSARAAASATRPCPSSPACNVPPHCFWTPVWVAGHRLSAAGHYTMGAAV